MLPGDQKVVLTPGRNQKHYLAGALHTRTGQVLWVGNGWKNSYLFLQLLRRLADAFPMRPRSMWSSTTMGFTRAAWCSGR
jgi:hypothetical protein